MSGVSTEPVRAHAGGATRGLHGASVAIALALFGCNSVLGIDAATLCDGACDAGVPPVAEDETRPPGAATPVGRPLDASRVDDPAESPESNAANLPLAPTNRAPADNASASSGADDSRGNSGRGNADDEDNSGRGNANDPPNGDDDDTSGAEPPAQTEPEAPPVPQPPPSRCDGRATGEAFCDGATRITCGAGGAVTNTLTCSSPAHCQVSNGPTCAACLTGEARCDGAALSLCNAAHSGFDTQACASPAQCNAAQRRCDTPACQPNQVRCEGALLQRCNGSLTGFDRVADCGAPAACNVDTASCNVCTPSASRCADEHTVASCDPNGQSEALTSCRPLIEICSSGRCEVLGLPL